MANEPAPLPSQWTIPTDRILNDNQTVYNQKKVTPVPPPSTPNTSSTNAAEYRQRNSSNANSSTNAAEYRANGGRATSTEVDFLRAKAVAWNPPAHVLTRAPQIAYDRSKRTPDKIVEGVARGRQGAIYTTLYQGNKNAFRKGTRYGLRFHYNPTSISYAYAVDPDRDPTANFVLFSAGLVNVNFEIYLNRIFDLDRPNISNYQPAIDRAALNEIVSRGTEYDLEFLYRAVNGDPVPVSHDTRLTADTGSLAYTLLTVQLGKSGMLFDGLLNSVSVNHILFTGDMVPTFSQVQLSFSRPITSLPAGVTKGGHQPDNSSVAPQGGN